MLLYQVVLRLFSGKAAAAKSAPKAAAQAPKAASTPKKEQGVNPASLVQKKRRPHVKLADLLTEEQKQLIQQLAPPVDENAEAAGEAPKGGLHGIPCAWERMGVQHSWFAGMQVHYGDDS